MLDWLAVCLGCLTLSTLLTPQAASDPPRQERPAQEPEKPPEPPPKPTWPRLSGPERRQVELNIKRLGHKDPERVEAAVDALKALGPGVAPLVLQRMSDALPRHNERLEEIASAVIQREHAPLLSSFLQYHLKAPRAVAARLLVKTNASEACPELRAALEKEEDPEVRETMGLALCYLGDPAGLTTLFHLALEDFMERRDELLAATAPLKGRPATEWLLERLDQEELSNKAAALRLLAVAGTRQAVAPIAPYIDHVNHILKAEAINALRVIVDGHPPLKHISMFDMIRLRQEWQARLPGLLRER